MPLANYGLLTGKLAAFNDQDGGNPHLLLKVKAGNKTYEVSVNLESTQGEDAPPELQYQIVADLRRGNSRSKGLASVIKNRNEFVLRAPSENLSLDFVHDGILNMAAFKTLPRGTDPKNNRYSKALRAAAAKAIVDANSFIAVFGSGCAEAGSSSPSRDSFGFTGVENVHMNQGTHYEVGRHLNHHYAENGPHQDGALLFYFSDGTVQGFFSKFQSQDEQTDTNGNPVQTNIHKLNKTPNAIRRTLVAGVAKRKKRAEAMLTTALKLAATKASKNHGKNTTNTSPASPSGGFVFADPPDAADPLRPFKGDDDSQVDQNFVDQFAKHGVPEPVPGPRNGQYPTMTLDSVIGSAAAKAIEKSGQIVIHMAGDTGASAAAKLPHETAVATAMLKDFTGEPGTQPAFFYHLGDVVYYFGEQDYYYDQFYHPYQKYPRPIFAIPGNHDGITYSDQMQSLAPFMSAFVDSAPQHWVAAGGLSRTTMTQPGVYFTLDAPFVSIIGLYSNCSESYGYLDQQQTLFLYNELVRLKPLRANGSIAAVLLAVHHPPMSYSASKPSSQALRNDIDKACTQAGFWPDAIFSGHAHLYQRMTRIVQANGADREIPHLVCGAGGYNLMASQEVDKADMKLQDTSDPQFRLHRFLAHYGYLKLTLTPAAGGKNGTLRIEFISPNINAGGAADACVLDLEKHQLL